LKTLRLIALTYLAPVLVCAAASGALAQSEWPRKQPIRIVVPYPPGGTNDIAARAVGEALAKLVGQAVIIDNRPGAAGAIGMDAVAKAPPDGYTYAVISDSVTLLNFTRKDMTWDFEKQFVPLAMISSQPLVVVVHAAQPYRTLLDLIAAAKAKPAAIPYATPGQGSIQHLTAELLWQRAGVSLQHVPYKGGGQAIIDLVGAQVPVGVLGPAAVIPHAASGKLRVLAQTTAARSPSLPDAPTVAESGFTGFDVLAWIGLVAVTAVPDDIRARMREEIAKAIGTPAVRKRLIESGLDPAAISGDRFESLVKTGRTRWGALIRQLGITLE
jgi:tripartite-type tricarboxylate transporter receptor subunit TctC